jgi:hypothetical protein
MDKHNILIIDSDGSQITHSVAYEIIKHLNNPMFY